MRDLPDEASLLWVDLRYANRRSGCFGGSLPSGCGVICLDRDVGDCASSHNGTPSPCTDEDVLRAPFESQSQLSPFSCGKNQSKSSAREG